MKRIVLLCGVVLAALPASASAQQFEPAGYVYHLYKSVLEREPKADEVLQWAAYLDGRMTPEDMRASFLGSDEFYRLHSRDARKFVAAAFVHVYRRPSSNDEFRYWGDRYWAVSANRVALCQEMMRAAKPVPVVIVRPDVLPEEPVPVPQPNARLVAQAEVSVVFVGMFVNGLAPCRDQSGTAGLEEQARTLGNALSALRRLAGENAPRAELHGQLRSAQAELFRLRERHRALAVAAPALPLPSLVDIVDALEALRPLVES